MNYFQTLKRTMFNYLASKPKIDGYLTFSSPSTFTLNTYNTAKNWDGTLEYSTDKSSWAIWNGASINSSSDGKLYLRGTGNTYLTGTSNYYNGRFVLTGSSISCTGNIETLLNYSTVQQGNHPTMSDSCFDYLFMGCSSLITAPELPATTLTNYCYDNMFQGCTGLTTAPELPAMTLATYCYQSMFSNCTGLTTAPVLPATTLATYCYYYMFANCTSLTTMPSLPATSLATYCYAYMFSGCTALTTLSTLPATTLATECYYWMFNGCTSLATLPNLPAITLAENCYNNMFRDCTGIKLATAISGKYQIAFRIPTTGTGTTASSALFNMFYGTGGTFTGTPAINTTYYLWDESATVYNITTSLTNCTGDATNPTTIASGETETLIFTADSGYELPSSVTVTGASYTWEQSTGVLDISNPTGNVSITIVGVASSYAITAVDTEYNYSAQDVDVFVKLNTAPTSANDYDFVSSGTLSSPTSAPVSNVSKLYIWKSVAPISGLGYARVGTTFLGTEIFDGETNPSNNIGYANAYEYIMNSDITTLHVYGSVDD